MVYIVFLFKLSSVLSYQNKLLLVLSTSLQKNLGSFIQFIENYEIPTRLDLIWVALRALKRVHAFQPVSLLPSLCWFCKVIHWSFLVQIWVIHVFTNINSRCNLEKFSQSSVSIRYEICGLLLATRISMPFLFLKSCWHEMNVALGIQYYAKDIRVKQGLLGKFLAQWRVARSSIYVINNVDNAFHNLVYQFVIEA